jgi:hypothetical protein
MKMAVKARLSFVVCRLSFVVCRTFENVPLGRNPPVLALGLHRRPSSPKKEYTSAWHPGFSEFPLWDSTREGNRDCSLMGMHGGGGRANSVNASRQNQRQRDRTDRDRHSVSGSMSHDSLSGSMSHDSLYGQMMAGGHLYYNVLLMCC